MDHPWMYTMDKHGETPATRARKSGYTVLAEMLLSRDRAAAKAEEPSTAPDAGKDAYWGMSHSVYKLMDSDAPAPETAGTEPPLHRATRDGNVDIIAEILAGGADIDEENAQGLSPLHLVALNGRTDLAEIFIDHGATVNRRESYTGKLTPMAMALLMGYDDLVAVMADHGGVC